MPSPFPGMNPYLERPAVWNDFHFRYLTALADSLGELVAPGYFVKIGEHLYIRDAWAEDETLAGYADLSVAPLAPPPPSPPGTTVATAPTTIELVEAFEPERSHYLEVVDRDCEEVVTVVELLSPTNKQAGPDRAAYLAKRAELIADPAHLIEIDLFREWKRMPGRNLPACDYCVMVSRYQDRPRAGYWGIGLRDPLPLVPVPLRGGATRNPASTSRPCCTGSTTPRGTATASTATPPNRGCRPATRRGQRGCSPRPQSPRRGDAERPTSAAPAA